MWRSIEPLQRVQNAAARLITGTGTRDHITPALRSLHWLPIKFRITFKLYVLMHLVHIDRAPGYLSDMVTTTAGPWKDRGPDHGWPWKTQICEHSSIRTSIAEAKVWLEELLLRRTKSLE